MSDTTITDMIARLTSVDQFAIVVLDSLQKQTFFNWEKRLVAEKNKQSTTVTRIKASSSTTPKKKKSTATSSKKAAAVRAITKSTTPVKGVFKPFSMLIGYLKGSWFELKQVTWPTRKATWGMTFAVIGFTLFFVLMIVVLDALFKYLFELILG